jgi:Domain of unknown function (DUF2019)
MSTLLQTLTDEELVDRFAQLAFQQHDALEADDADAYNELSDRMTPIEVELTRRGSSSYGRLERLLGHPNITVRLETARRLMDTTPGKARPVLQQIQRSGHFPHVGDAGMLLAHYDSKP